MGNKTVVDIAEWRSSKPASQNRYDLLERVALALNSTLELKEVLRLLAQIILEATGGQRCSLFLLEGRQLHPAVAIGTWSDEDLWNAFHSMAPTDLDIPRWRLFLKGQPVALEDARESDLIPKDWVDRFSLRALALVPLMAGDEPYGLMAVDWPEARSFDESEIRRLGAIGSYAGVAVRNARLFEVVKKSARIQEALAAGASALASPLEPAEIAQRLADAYLDLLGAELCAIGLFDSGRTKVTTIAARGTREISGPLPLAEVPKRIVARLVAEWTKSKNSVSFGDDPWLKRFVACQDTNASWYLLVPMVAEGHPRGVVLLGFGQKTRLGDEEHAAAETLATVAAVAVERNFLVERLNRQMRQLEILYRLTASIHQSTGAAALMARLNELLTGYGIEAVGLAFRESNFARRLGGEKLTPAERAVFARNGGPKRLDDETLAVPMRLGRRLVGVLRVRVGALEAEEQSFLEAVGSGIAEVATMAALRSAFEEASRERAVAGERERFASDLHDTAGQLFVASGLLARRFVGQLPSDSPWAERILRLVALADRGKWEIDQAIRALSFVPAARSGLPTALRALARSFESDSGIHAPFRTIGKPPRLAAEVERTLYRVAHEATSNAWRHARCTIVRLELAYEDSEVVLRILDDGIGLNAREKEGSPGIGIFSMRRAMEAVGGCLRVRSRRPRGVLVEARVKRGPR